MGKRKWHKMEMFAKKGRELGGAAGQTLRAVAGI